MTAREPIKILFETEQRAEQWCKAWGYAIGTRQRDDGRGLMRGPYVVAKWRNLSGADRRALHGIWQRHPQGEVTVTLYHNHEHPRFDGASLALSDAVPCVDCASLVDVVEGCCTNGERFSYFDSKCGRCGKPICWDCAAESRWLVDGDRCCARCCQALNDEQARGPHQTVHEIDSELGAGLDPAQWSQG